MKPGFLYLLLLWMFVGCSDQVDNRKTTTEGKARVTFSLKVGSMLTKAGELDETTINTLDVLVFEETEEGSDIYTYQDVCRANNTGASSYELELENIENKVRFYLLANVDLEEANLSLSPNDNFETARQKLNVTFQADNLYLPMAGETAPVSLSEGETVNLEQPVALLRAIAAIDISDLTTEGDFELVSVQVFRANQLVQLLPATEAWGQEGTIISASVPEGTGIYNSSPVEAVSGDEKIRLYLPESEAQTGDAQTNAATCLVVGGRYNSGNISYYRIDIKNKSGAAFGQLLRNHLYKVYITKISEEGYTDPAQAAANPSRGMDVNVIEMDDGDGQMIFGPDGSFLIIGTNPIRTGYFVGATTNVTITTDAEKLSFAWADETLSGSSTMEWVEGTSSSAILTGKYISLQINSYTENNGMKILNLAVAAVEENSTSSERTEQAIIAMGELQVGVTVMQKGKLARQHDFIDVFNYVSHNGYLGDEIMGNIPLGIQGQKLADLMKKNEYFSTTGTLPFGGFDFSGFIRDQTPLTEGLLDLYDIVYLTDEAAYKTYTPEGSWQQIRDDEYASEMGKSAIEWVSNYPNRILLTTFDNKPFIESIGLDIDFTEIGWSPGWEPASATSPAWETYGVISPGLPSYIKNGPFGSVDINASAIAAPNAYIIDRSREANKHLTPILVAQGYPDEMFICMDEEKKIIYYSGYNWFESLLTGNGNNNTAHDTLILNLLAWMVEVVFEEELAPDL